MRSMVVRQRLVRAAAVATSVALAAACSAPKNGGNSESTGAGPSSEYQAGMLLVSDGTNVVTIGSRKVTFPTTVTDAAWSPDGSRIAFVDGDGNLTTARPDGSGRVVLTSAKPGIVRSRPTWNGSMIAFAEKRPDGTSVLMAVQANGCPGSGALEDGSVPVETGDGTGYVDLSPSTSERGAPGWHIAFQHEEPSGSQIWVTDTTQRTPRNTKVADGTEPSMSPDATKVAFVAANGQIQVLDLQQSGSAPVQVTFGVQKPRRIVWNPDGAHLAFATPTDIESVALNVAAGASANPTTRVFASTGVPTYLRPHPETVSRITAADPVALAVAASQSYWPTSRNYVSSQGYRGTPGAMLTSPTFAPKAFAATGNFGPLLYTSRDGLDAATKAELNRLFGTFSGATGRPTIAILGDLDVVSAGVQNALKVLGYDTTRAPLGPEPPLVDGTTSGCGPQNNGDAGLFEQTLVVVDPTSTVDYYVARHLAENASAPLLKLDPKAGLTEPVKTWLAASSASINRVLIVDSAGAIPADVDKQIGELISGPLSFTTGTNPTVPPLSG